MEPRVFYGPPKSRTPSPPRDGSGSGSEAETEIEEPVKRFKRLHRRLDSTDSSHSSSGGERQERKRSRTSQQKVSARDTHGRQPLQRACARGDYEMVVELVKGGADILDRDYAGTTALHSAALQGDPRVVKFLLEHGAIADIRSGPDELDTPLMDAVSSSNLPVINLLLEHGADPRVQNSEGKTTIDFLDEGDESYDEIHEILRQESLKARKKGLPIQDPSDGPKGMFPPQLDTIAAANGDKNGEERKASAGRPRRRNDLLWFDVTTRTGRMEVCKRAAQGDIEYIGMSLEHGWQPSAEALVQAAKFGHTDIVGLLLAFGKSPDDLYKGATALHETIGRGHLEVVKLLIDGGADPNWKDGDGQGYLELVKDLPPDDEERLFIEKVCSESNTEDRTENQSPKPKVEKRNPVPKRDDTKSQKPREERKPERHSEKKHIEKSEKKVEKKLDKKLDKKDERRDSDRRDSDRRDSDRRDSDRRDSDRRDSDRRDVKKEPKPEPDVVAPVPRKPKEVRVRFDNIDGDRRVKSLDRATPSISPRSTPPPQQSAEEIKRLEELALKRERDRKAREAEMLSSLEKQEQRAAERRERLSGEFESHSAQRSPSVPPAAPNGSPPPSTASPKAGEVTTPTGSEPNPQISSPGLHNEAILSKVPFAKVSVLPYALQVLSVAGTPQPVEPLLVHKRKGQEYVLDVQLALALGMARLHAEHPELTKVSAGHDLPAVWGLISPWMARKGATQEELSADKAKFEALKLNWIPLAEAHKLPGADGLQTVRISLQAPAPAPALKNTYENVPLRLAAQMSANRASSHW